MAGEGPIRARLERDLSAMEIPARFVGWVEGEAKQKLFDEADLLVFPSTWPEPFGLVGLEAAAAGLPAVAFDLGGIREWLVPGRTGELAPATPPSSGGLGQAIARAAQSAANLERLGDAAREHSLLFNVKRHLAGLEAILQEALHERSAVPRVPGEQPPVSP